MVNLENIGIQSLNQNELINIQGGGRIKTLKRIAEWLGIVEMAEDFYEGVKEGYNEHRQ